MIGQRIGIGGLLLGLGLAPNPGVIAQPNLTTIKDPSVAIAEADRLRQQVLELYQQSQYAAAIPLAQEVLRLRRHDLGAEDPQIATALNTLALLYRGQGRYTEAEMLLKQAIEIDHKALPENHLQIAAHLNNLALIYRDQGRYTEAEPLLKQAIEINNKSLSENHPQIALNFNNLAEIYRGQGRYTEAEMLLKQAIEIDHKALPENHLQIAAHFNNLALIYRDQGRYTEAEPLLKQAIEINNKSLSENHPQIALNLNNLAELYRGQGRYAEAEPLLKQTIEINRKALPENHPQIALNLNNLALIYYSQGRYTEAEPLLKQAIEINRKALPENHPQIAGHLNNLAELYRDQGRYTEAEMLYKQAIEINHKALPENHPQIAAHLNNLAELHRAQGRYTEAEMLYKRAIEINHKALPENHPQIAAHLNNLALIYRDQGRYTEAELVLKQAIEINHKALPENHPQIATNLNNLAELYRDQGRYTEAEMLYKQAIEIAHKALPENHPQIATHLNNLAGLYWAQNNVQQTLTTLNRGVDIEENNLAINLDFGAEAQKRSYLALFSGTTNATISLQQQLAFQNPQAQNLALTTILRRKGRLLDIQVQTLNRIRQATNPNLRPKLEELAQLKTTLSILANQGPQTSNPKDYLQKRQNLEKQITQLEAKLSQASAELRLQLNPVTLAQVQAQIPSDAVLIEFMLYKPYNPKAPHQERWGPNRYAVYLLTPQGPIQWADLGPADELNPLIQQFRDDVAEPYLVTAEVRASAQKLYKKLLQPIQSHLAPAQHLLIAPDGPLNLIPFEALVDQQQQYLLETYQITYLSSGRDLLRLQGPIPKTKGPLLIASPNYNLALTSPRFVPAEGESKTGMARLQESPHRSREFRGNSFLPLPEALKEGEELDKLLKNSRLLIGEAATETALKNSPAPNVLHIATHGVFLKDQPLPKTNESEAFRQQFENPLLRSWLAFAGANHPQPSPDDGILTAFEVTGLNLQGTQLVALSACQTGRGEVVNGEGVYGLRRAFTLAGARSQLMSLWNVRDVSTKDLMIAYYKRLQNGEGRGSALRAVQLQMLRGEIKDPKGKTYIHPYFWAAFVRTGDWTPMDLQ